MCNPWMTCYHCPYIFFHLPLSSHEVVNQTTCSPFLCLASIPVFTSPAPFPLQNASFPPSCSRRTRWFLFYVLFVLRKLFSLASFHSFSTCSLLYISFFSLLVFIICFALFNSPHNENQNGHLYHSYLFSFSLCCILQPLCMAVVRYYSTLPFPSQIVSSTVLQFVLS